MKPRHVTADSTETLGAKLEHDRLTREGTPPDGWYRRVEAAGGRAARRNRHIQQVITEFEAEVAATNARLNDLAAGTPPARNWRDPPRDWRTP